MKKSQVGKRDFGGNGITSTFLTFFLLIGLMLLSSSGTKAQSVEWVDKYVEEALLTEDWGRVSKILDSVNTRNSSPVIRLIKAHAGLALNRNNESFCLFLSTSSQNDLQRWWEWTEVFVEKNQGKAMTHYFRGDALARLKQWDRALDAFNRAHRLSPRNPLILNARGVVYAAKEEWYKAISDFENASKANESFADAFANRGTVVIHKKAGAEGALKWFSLALKKSDSFALARYELGYIKVVLGETDKGPKEIQDASKELNCLNEIVNKDLVNVAEWLSAKEKIALAENSSEEVGTTLNRILKDIDSKGDLGGLNKAARLLGQNPEYSKDFMAGLNGIVGKRPDLASKIGEKINNGFGWTKPDIGGARGFLNILEGFQFGGVLGKDGGKITGGLGFGPFAQQHQIKTNLDNKGWESMLNNFKGPDNIGGATSQWSNPRLDEGDWPFEPHYGLLYPVKSKADTK